MVLADDNFASITAAVKEGRTVYNNIEKAILFMLPTNVAQALVILVAIFVGFTTPITAPQIFWVNIVTSVALGLVISFEPHELDVMLRPPRAVDRPILDAFGVWRVVFVGAALLVLTLWAFFWMKSQGGLRPARAHGRSQRAGDRAGVLSPQQPLQDQLVAVADGPPRQPVFPAGIGAVIVLQLLYTYAPPLQPCSRPRACRSASGRGSSSAASSSSSSSRPRRRSFRAMRSRQTERYGRGGGTGMNVHRGPINNLAVSTGNRDVADRRVRRRRRFSREQDLRGRGGHGLRCLSIESAAYDFLRS